VARQHDMVGGTQEQRVVRLMAGMGQRKEEEGVE
jgi:hypothetical protein